MTLTELIAALRRQTNLTTSDISDADVTSVLNEGLWELASYMRWPWLYTDATITTVANQVEYSAPADFAFMGIIQRASSKDAPLTEISFESYSMEYGDDANTSANALAFYLRDDTGTLKIGLWPTPSTATTDKYKLYYYQAPTELSAGGDSPAFAEQFHQMLVDYAAYRVWEREEYFDESDRAFGRFTRRVRDMIQFYKMRSKDRQLIVGDGLMANRYWHSGRWRLGID